jgi:hypothetical protein
MVFDNVGLVEQKHGNVCNAVLGQELDGKFHEGLVCNRDHWFWNITG